MQLNANEASFQKFRSVMVQVLRITFVGGDLLSFTMFYIADFRMDINVGNVQCVVLFNNFLSI